MEENNKAEEKKMSYEELEKVALELQQRYMQAEKSLSTINITAMRLDYLFKVLDKATYFDVEFVQKCVDEITELLDIKKESKEDTDGEDK